MTECRTVRDSALHRFTGGDAAVQRFYWIYANPEKLKGKTKRIKVHYGAKTVEMGVRILTLSLPNTHTDIQYAYT